VPSLNASLRAQNALRALKAVFGSWRLGAVSLFSFASGLPLGLVTLAIPTWMTMAGEDLKTVGFLTAAQAPYAFKFLWSPWIDRFGFARLPGKRGWIFAAQAALAALTFALAALATTPSVGLVAALTLLIAFASASQDIAIDAYAVEVLRPDEQGMAVGARTAIYRAAMWLSGALAVSIGPVVGWNWTLAALALIYLLLLPATLKAPDAEQRPSPPRSLGEALIAPFLQLWMKPRALEIVAFVLLYKLADNLAVALVRPFLVQTGFDPIDVGVVSGTVGLVATLVGTFLGGLFTQRLGVGRALWIFGLLQAFGNGGYALVAHVGPDRALLYAASALDSGASGLGTGAFMVLLLRLTSKRFSATQYALFSSLFALGRTVAGPIAGLLADALGWRDFFLWTIAFSLPGLALLQRFVPWRARDLPPAIEGDGSTADEHDIDLDAIPKVPLLRALASGALIGFTLATTALMGLDLFKTRWLGTMEVFDAGRWLQNFALPSELGGALDLFSALTCGLITGLALATKTAVAKARLQKTSMISIG
jgi:PAT family beta-lactamase induction signal transducer AmpG